MIHVVASIQIQEGRRDEFLTHFRALVPEVHAETGCIEYGPTVDVETQIGPQLRNADRVVVIEKWESLAALEAHLQAPHMVTYREKVKDLVLGTELLVLQPAD